MGIPIDREDFSDADYARFSGKLEASLEVLAELLQRPGFGDGPCSIGAELEVSLVDDAARPLPLNGKVLAETLDARLTHELDRWNLESNLRHGPLAGAPFAALRRECVEVLAEMSRAAALHGGRVAMIGILPTLVAHDFDGNAITESLRYRALSRGLRRLRDAPFELDIRGEDHLQLSCESVAFEGAGTSFQVHLRVPPRRFADTYNAVQLATPPVLAAAGNSPIFLGRRLWEETRVALFKQSVDPRRERGRGGEVARVSFGDGWIDGPLELFERSVRSHPPLLPVMDEREPSPDAKALPPLRELRLHQGTVWSWNRPIYDPAEGGHLRIEMRSLPAGPTVTDMLANAAFHIGLALAIAQDPPEWGEDVDFGAVQHDFYRAAQRGLDAALHWPRACGGSGEPAAAHALALELLPRAQAGLDAAGVERSDSAPLLESLDRRLRAGATGARWQRAALARAEATRSRPEALRWMLEGYLDASQSGVGVAEWPGGGA